MRPPREVFGPRGARRNPLQSPETRLRQAARKWIGIVVSIGLVGWFIWWGWDVFPVALAASRQASPVWLAAAFGAQILHILLRLTFHEYKDRPKRKGHF